MNPDLKKETRTAFLLSLILHITLAFVLGIVLIEPPDVKTRESVSVEIAQKLESISPPRRIATRDSMPDLGIIKKQNSKNQFHPKPIKREDVNIDPSRQTISGIPTTNIPEFTTNVDRLRTKFDMALSKPVGVQIQKPGTDTKRSVGDGSGGAGVAVPPSGADIFETALYWIARNLAGKNKTGKEDIVFLIDASGSMDEKIAAVARYLSKMIEVFKETNLDYTMGVIRFNYILKFNDVKIFEQTKDANQIRSILRSIKCDGDERTLDAIEIGLTQVKFRQPADITFILVTDEPFTARILTRQTRPELNLKQMLQEDFLDILRMCKEKKVKVNILGVDDEMQKTLAKETEGLWFQVPQSDEIR